MKERKSILIFGGGILQQYLIDKAKAKGLFTIVIDPDENAFCKNRSDIFKVVNGKDVELTLKTAKDYNVSGIVTTATDKPLVMMATIAEKLCLPFYSVNTAINSTDKLKMKEIFNKNDISCAKGVEVENVTDYSDSFPIIVKPRDNSGSRGVYFCKNSEELESVFNEVKKFTSKETVLIEEYIEGQEYSIESLHFDGRHQVIQITEKTTTPFPYNVELEHKQPAQLSQTLKNEISQIIEKIGVSFNFENCASHTELKINDRGEIKIIETSPRLGGDYITSHLVPLSTGVDIESLLLDIALGVNIKIPKLLNNASMVYFFHFPSGEKYLKTDKLNSIRNMEGIVDFEFQLKEGDIIPIIKSSLDRYGHIIIQNKNYNEMLQIREKLISYIE